jgi:hypothetical protein
MKDLIDQANITEEEKNNIRQMYFSFTPIQLEELADYLKSKL